MVFVPYRNPLCRNVMLVTDTALTLACTDMTAGFALDLQTERVIG